MINMYERMINMYERMEAEASGRSSGNATTARHRAVPLTSEASSEKLLSLGWRCASGDATMPQRVGMRVCACTLATHSARAVASTRDPLDYE